MRLGDIVEQYKQTVENYIEFNEEVNDQNCKMRDSLINFKLQQGIQSGPATDKIFENSQWKVDKNDRGDGQDHVVQSKTKFIYIINFAYIITQLSKKITS